MNLKSKIFLFFATLFCLSFFSCNNVDSADEGLELQNADDGKTYLQVNNNSQFDINVYFQSPSYADPWATIKVGESAKKEIAASSTNAGDGIYIQYLYPIGNIVIPYYDVNNTACIQVKQILEKQVNSIKVSPLSSLTMDTKYLIVKNESDADITLYDGTSPVVPLYQEKYWITSGNYRIYEVNSKSGANSISSLENCKLGNGIVNKALGIKKMEQGNIYTVRYSNTSVDLISVTPIDITAKEKIWKIPLSQTTGKYLTADKFSVRENSSDGYFFTGQLSYNTDFRNEKSEPYLAEISPRGEVSDWLLSLKDSPNAVKSNQVIEKNGMRIVAGEKYTSSGKKVPLIYGDNGCDFYIEPTIEDFYRFTSIIYKGGQVFSLLFELEGDAEIGFGILELTVKSFSEAEGKIVYSDKTGLYVWDFLYANSEYIVLVQEDSDDNSVSDKSKLLFINDNDFTISETKILGIYLFNSIACSNDGKTAFMSGSYKDSKTGKDVASFIKFDLENRTLSNNGIPKSFPATENNLNSNFNCLSIKNNEVFFAGYIDRGYIDDKDEYTLGYPYLVSYDADSDKINWSQIYNDKAYAGFEIFSCYLSAIGTPLIEIYNFNTDMSYLASCGLLGEIPQTELASLPRNTRISDVIIPNVSITIKDSNDKEYKISVPLDTEFSLSDFNKKVIAECTGFVVPEGKVLSKWLCKDEGGNNKDAEFPLKITETVELSPVFAITPPTGLSASKQASNSISLTWTKNASASSYCLYYVETSGDSENYQPENIKRLGTATNNTYTYTNENLVLGGNFAFFVSSIDADGKESAKSEPFFFKMSAEENSGGGGSGGGGNENPVSENATYTWNFQNIDLSQIHVKAWSGQSDTSKIHTDYTVGDLANVVLTELYGIDSTPKTNKRLVLAANRGAYNLIDNDKMAGLTKKEQGASDGCIDPNAEATVYIFMQGPFDVKMFVSANSESDKTDRHAFIRIAGKEYTDSTYSDRLPATGYWHTASYTGTDNNVLVEFGGTGIVRIWDIVITTKAANSTPSTANITVVDSNNNEYTVKLPTESSISSDALKKELPSDIFVQNGKFLTGYQVKNADGTYSDVVFPYIPKGDIKFYAKYEALAAVTDLQLTNYVTGSSSSFSLSWSAVDNADSYQIYYVALENSDKAVIPDLLNSTWTLCGTVSECSATVNMSSASVSIARVTSAGGASTFRAFKVIAVNTPSNVKSAESNIVYYSLYRGNSKANNNVCTGNMTSEDKSVSVYAIRTAPNSYTVIWNNSNSYYIHFDSDLSSDGYWPNTKNSRTTVEDSTNHSKYIRFWLSSSETGSPRVSNYITIVDK